MTAMTREQRRMYYEREKSDPVRWARRLAKAREAWRTPERKAYVRAYNKTNRGKASRRVAMKKFNASEKGRELRRAYLQTPKGRAAARRYYLTPPGVLRSALKRALDRHKARWPTDPSSLTHAQLIELFDRQGGLCALSGIKLTWGRGAVQSTSLSIDRLDSRRGYHLDNVRLICTAINAFRGNGTDAEMIELARAIITHHQRQGVFA